MEPVLSFLKKATENNWLVNHDSQAFWLLTEELIADFEKPGAIKIILAESNPIRFMAAFMAACSHQHQVFLANPCWGLEEWQQVFELVQPDLVWGDGGKGWNEVRGEGGKESVSGGLIMIPTGGTSGTIRFAMHTLATLEASVRGFCEYFDLQQVNFICVLPLYHVSGLMQWLRCLITGGRLLIIPFQEVKEGRWCGFDGREFFISLVPTQLEALLRDSALVVWLRRIHTVLLGGAPAWGDLLERAFEHKIKLAMCYGMTETASQIATLKPEDFLGGKRDGFKVLPHAKVKIYDQYQDSCGVNQVGSVVIESKCISLGYYPNRFSPQEIFTPDDLGFIDDLGYLYLVGRQSDKIITGGENVFPQEVENVIRSTGLVKDVQVIGVPDAYWGELITAVYVPVDQSISGDEIHKAMEGKLARFKLPKLWLVLDAIPRNAQGKVNREKLKQVIRE